MNFVEHSNSFGVETKEIPCIKGSGAPTTATVGAVGVFYMDTLTGKTYKCIAVTNGVYTWKPFGDGDEGGGEGTVGSNIEIVQGTGDSENAVMSQKATTDYVKDYIPKVASRNLMDLVFENATINNKGVFATTTSVNCSASPEYLEVKGGETYTFSWAKVTASENLYIHQYRADKTHISGTEKGTTTSPVSITLESDCAFIRVSLVAWADSTAYTDTIPEKFQLELGDEATEYNAPLVISPEYMGLTDALSGFLAQTAGNSETKIMSQKAVTDFVKDYVPKVGSRNLMTLEFQNATITNKGIFATSTSKNCSASPEYLAVTGGEAYTFSWSKIIARENLCIHQHRADKTFISMTEKGTVTSPVSITLDSECAFIRIAFVAWADSTHYTDTIPEKFQLELGDVATDYIVPRVIDESVLDLKNPLKNNLVQTEGDDEMAVMSQKATTESLKYCRDLMLGKDVIKNIDLTKYKPINFNLEGGTQWTAQATYRSALIPVEHFYDTVMIEATSYAAKLAFLKDDYAVAGEEAHLCESEGKVDLKAGATLCRYIPADCKFVYVYISDGSVIDKFSIKTTKVSLPAGDRLVNDTELDLALFGQEYYQLENRTSWAYDKSYRCVLIPTKTLTRYVKLYSKEYKCVYALLKNNTMNNGEKPNLCSGESITVLNNGEERIVEIPNDCKYIYIYISNGTFFGKFGLVRLSEKTQTAIMHEKIEGGKVFINDTEQMLLTLKHMHTGSVAGFSGENTSDNLLTMTHTSDVHTDLTSYSRFIGFANDNEDKIDCAIVSGDLVDSLNTSEACTQMIQRESELSESIPLLKCMGNHEKNNGYTLAEIYTMYNMNTPTGELYYYKDFATKKIRIICLNQYEGSAGSYSIRYSQEQINWFISALSDATAKGYAVVVVYHSCEEVGFPTHNYSGFCQELKYQMTPLTTKPIISDIINAFQNGATLNDTYTIADTTVTVSADFTSKGIFVCYLCGHQHVDYIGYSKVYPNQLICMVQGGVINSAERTEAQAHWQSRYDTPRVEGTSTADSINVYSIDTTNRLLKVVKIGSTMTDKFVPRTFATFGF